MQIKTSSPEQWCRLVSILVSRYVGVESTVDGARVGHTVRMSTCSALASCLRVADHH